MKNRLKKLARSTDEKFHSLFSPFKNCSEECKKQYEEEVFKWKHTYHSWIAENEQVLDSFDEAYYVDNCSLGNEDKRAKLSRIIPKEFVLFISGGGYVSSSFEYCINEYLKANEDADGIYADDDFFVDINGKKERMCPFFKPDFSDETLLSFNYFGNLFLLREDIARDILRDISKYADGIKGESEDGNGSFNVEGNISLVDELTLYDISLRAAEKCKKIGHLCHVLFHKEIKDWTEFKNYDEAFSVLSNYLEGDENISKVLCGSGEDGLKIRQKALSRRNHKGKIVKAGKDNIYNIEYENNDALVSVVILSKDNPELLNKCVTSLKIVDEYKNKEIIVVDNGSNSDNKIKCEKLSNEWGFKYYYHPMEFNFSVLCNYGVSKSKGNLVLLMNDDVECTEPNSIGIMAGMAQKEGIGCVGARLLYGDGTSIQHVGVTSLGIGPSHQLQKKPDIKNYYFGRNRVNYNMLAVTAACLMVKKSIYEEVLGLNEELKVAYNDVDFCMKVHKKGYRNIECNGAKFIHHESLSRGYDGDDSGKWERLLSEKEKLYLIHPEFKGYDPYHNINLIDNSSEYVNSHKTPAQDLNFRSKFSEINEKEVADFNNKNLKFRLTMDHAALQRRFNKDDEDFYWIDGWAYVPGADQACFKKTIILKCIEGNCLGKYYMVESVDTYRPDVKDLLQGAKNAAMTGFLARLGVGDIPKGKYCVGLKMEADGTSYVSWSESILC